jgi:hypothetical protein
VGSHNRPDFLGHLANFSLDATEHVLAAVPRYPRKPLGNMSGATQERSYGEAG